METPAAAQPRKTFASETQPYPSSGATMRYAGPTPEGAQRLLWTLDGPLETAVWVMAAPNNPDEREPLYNKSTDTWHPIAQLSVTDPWQSSVTVHVFELDEWEENWCELHRDHSEPFSEENFPGAKWGWFEKDGVNHEGDDDYANEPQLLKCCNIERPRGKAASVVVTPAVATTTDGDNEEEGGGGFVTVKDYVTTVHPWLMDHLGDILGALATVDGDYGPLPEDTVLAVDFAGSAQLMMMDRDEWIELTRRKPVRVIGDGTSVTN